jgi:hypothetical protein
MGFKSGNLHSISGSMKPWLRGRISNSSMALEMAGVGQASNAFNSFGDRESVIVIPLIR